MKKVLLLMGVAVLTGSYSFAQSHDAHAGHDHAAPASATTAQQQAIVNADDKPATTLTVENMQFEIESHDFGTVPEGPAAEYEFTFTNTGKEPINLQTVNASCGCTTPIWSKEPVLPGKKGVVKASYNTDKRPGGFNKSITVVSNAGTKVLTIKGTVEPAPSGSAPAPAKSMISK